ncbi:MAG: MFS transporter [Dehalococcoidia bacterium]|nr:MFS transporter [Dehalococcoidia bacterium]
MQRHLRHIRLPATTVLIFLAIEFLDELVDGVGSAAWPLVRNDLNLNYVHIGLLLSVPGIFSTFIEPVIGILGDVGYRRLLVVGGGVAFAAAVGLVSVSQGFVVLLIAWIIFFPASGAFVSLSQASLMDYDPKRREQNMARWVFAGSVANVLGPLALAAAIAIGIGWRGAFLATAVLAIPAVIAAYRLPFGAVEREPDRETQSFREGIRTAVRALKRFEVVRWLTLLQASDLMLDIFKSFLALYMVDIAGVSESRAALTIAVWVGVGLIGDLLLIPLLERVRGLTYLRYSVVVVLLLYPAFLLAPSFEIKLVIAGLLGFANAGWYSILQGQAYSSLPGRSGTIVALGNVFGIVAWVVPLGLGVVSATWGLDTAMWLLLAGPVVLLIGLVESGMRGERK